MNRFGAKWIVCGLLLATCLAPAAEQTNAKPNFVVILADDMGAGEIGCYGNAKHKTPNLDKLADTGVKFETAFACPVCHPTRFMIMTGQYGCHNGIYNFSRSRGGPEQRGQGVDDITNHVTFAQLIRPRGYATALAGKWQLSGQAPTLIFECGFDEYCAWGYKEYFSDEDREKAEKAGINFRSRYWRPSIITNAKFIPTTLEDYGPDIFTDFVIDFIKRKKDRPFFVYYPMCLTHGPWHATPDTTRSDADKKRNSWSNFKANVEYTDKLVGRIVSALDQLGLRNNTIIFFTADNGTARRGKSEATERGARVPLIVNGPRIIRTRRSTMELTDLSDIMPTLVELAGAKLPTDRPIDGRSYAAFLRGQKDTTREWIFAYQADRRILRTKRWLLEDNSPLHYGRLYDCGNRRNGKDYKEVTDSNAPEVAAIKKQFADLLKDLPAPYIPTEGPPNERKSAPKRKKQSE